MEKRLIVAIALSLLVLLSWSTFVAKTQHIDNKPVTAESPKTAVIAKPEIPKIEPQAAVLIPPEDNTNTVFLTPNLSLTFDDARAAIKEVIFKNYHSHRYPIQYGFALDDPNLIFKKQSAAGQEITFVHQDRERVIVKRYLFGNSNYTIELDISIQNLSSAPLRTKIGLIPVIFNFAVNGNEASYQDLAVSREEKILRPNPRKPGNWDKIKFLTWRERYFCGVLEPAQPWYSLSLDKIGNQEFQPVLRSQELLLAPGEKISQKFHIYLGPQDLPLINSINSEWTVVVNYGAFDFIAQMLIQFLGLLHNLMRNWGLTIILLSLAIYFLLYPLTIKQMRSMKAMQALQPRIEQLRAANKDNPQRLNKEIMELYRENKVNPFGGCLPMILQIPIFFALYQVLMRSVSLKGAPFLWITDLSEPDKLFTLSQKLPLIGDEINILPILMAITMFLQQKLSSKSMSGTSAEQQKIMLILFPVMFGFIFYRMPSGLVLYWFVNSILMLGQQILISRNK